MRRVLCVIALVIGMPLAVCILSCRREQAPAAGGTVVLYGSADEVVARPIIERFERESGVRVVYQGDTEATKTTGLVQRLRAERDSPRADVFWSSEAFLTDALGAEGLLAPLVSSALADWPESFRDPRRLWHGFALRARVIVYNTKRVGPEEAPRQIAELADDARWRGRIVMARPAFGTTRGHLAALVALWGEAAAREWLEALGAGGVRLLDGNSAVVRAVAMGEADVGLTDTDDVWAGRRQGWPVDLVYARHDLAARGDRAGVRAGPLLIPNTVALVARGPNPAAARRLAEYLLSEPVERALAESESRNIPVRAALAVRFPGLAVPDPAAIPIARISASMDAAMRLAREVLGP